LDNKDKSLSPDKLTPAQIKEIIREKGWTQVAIGIRWGLGSRRMNQIVQDIDRNQYYDDGFLGLDKRERGKKTTKKV